MREAIITRRAVSTGDSYTVESFLTNNTTDPLSLGRSQSENVTINYNTIYIKTNLKEIKGVWLQSKYASSYNHTSAGVQGDFVYALITDEGKVCQRMSEIGKDDEGNSIYQMLDDSENLSMSFDGTQVIITVPGHIPSGLAYAIWGK